MRTTYGSHDLQKIHFKTWKKPHAIRRLQSMEEFLAQTEVRGKRIFSPHDVKVENVSNGENRSVPH